MPPITEKRSPSIIKGNVKENFPSANGTSSTTASAIAVKQPLGDKIENRVPEIVDFRDSWLQEIEMYKDHLKTQQLLLMQQHNHQSHHVQHSQLHHTHNLSQICYCEGPASHQEDNDIAKEVDPAKRRVRTYSDSDSYESIRRLLNETDEGRAREDYCTSVNKNKLRHDNRHRTRNRKRKSPSPSITTATITPLSPSSSLARSTSTSLCRAPIEHEQNQALCKEQCYSTTALPKVIANPIHTNLSDNFGLENKLALINGCIIHQACSSLNNKEVASSAETTFTTNLKDNTELPLQSNIVKSAPSQSIVKTPPIVDLIRKPNTSNLLPTTTTGAYVPSTVNKVQPSHESKDNLDLSYMNNNTESDDEFFGDIDEADIYDSSDNDDNEYTGYAYYLEDEEGNQKSLTAYTSKSNKPSESYGQYITPKSPLSCSLFPNVPPFLNFSSHIEKGPSLPNEIQKLLKWKLSNVMPKIVRRVVSNSGFRLIRKTNDWMGTWEKHMKSPGFKLIRSHQKFNHLPGTFRIGRKDSAWKNLCTFTNKHGKKEFGFMPKTFILPQDLDQLKKAWPRYVKRNTKWIIKPPASARGTGIKVVNRWSQIPKTIPLIVQKYIERPLLIEGSKFDLRLYVLVTSINPLRIFLHTDGLARFASVQYSDKLDTLHDRCMHLTNYSVNKLSSNYAKNEDINACQGHKWTLKSLWSYLEKRKINTIRLWATLRNLIIKTIISGESCLNKMFKSNVGSKYSCYELFGFDVLLDENLVPWLLEVNISPSLHSELGLDQHIKGPLVQAVLNTTLYQIPLKVPEQLEKKVLDDFNLKGPLSYDKRIFTSYLSSDEINKHKYFTSSVTDDREDYLETILEKLTPDDVRCLIIAEDELARSVPLERIFPSSESYSYLKFIEGPRYYNRLLDAWEAKYSKNRSEGICVLRELCETKFHLQVPIQVTEKNSKEILQNVPTNYESTEILQTADETIKNSKTNSNLSDTAKVIMNSGNKYLNETNELVSSPLIAPISCSKEAVATIASTSLDPESQSNGPRPIAVEIK